MVQTWKQKLTSRKFLMAVSAVSINLIIIITGKEVDTEVVISLTSIVAAWIAGETVLDRKVIELNGAFASRLAAAQMAAFYEQLDSETKVPESGVAADASSLPFPV